MFEALTSWENLLRAYREASRGKRRHPNVAAFEHRLEDELVSLRQELRERTWQPGSYKSFYIHEPKRRSISAAPFRDRVAHHALVQMIEPLARERIAPSIAVSIWRGGTDTCCNSTCGSSFPVSITQFSADALLRSFKMPM